jgi:inner membrane protein
MPEVAQLLSTPWLWFIVAAVLLIGELMLPGVFLLWISMAAFLTGVSTLLLSFGWSAQIAEFAFWSALMIIAARSYASQQKTKKTDQPFLNQRHHAYVGQQTVLTHAITNGIGKVRFEDALWDVRGPDLDVGTKVMVTGVEGMTLKVVAV